MRRLAATVSLLLVALSGTLSAQSRLDPNVIALQAPTQDADSTRDQLQNLLQQLPPNVRRVLQLDPSLAERSEYLALYPQLQAFIKVHPEITRNPAYFFGNPDEQFNRRRDDPIEWFAGILAGMGVFIVVMTILVFFGLLVRQTVDYRRWVRQTRLQNEVHTKILDRMQSNDELLAYVQTPAGRHFLEFTPISTESAPKTVSAPLSRILWSVQAGVVLAALGLGFRYAQSNVPEEIVPAFTVLGVVVMALGLGAVVSAVVAYLLSARLGLLPARREEETNA
jgi:hypothetical protein